MTEFVSIKEFSKRAGISPQAVYKQLENKLQGYWKEVDGKKVLSLKALELFKSNQNDNALLNELTSIVNVLKEQLAAKDKQIAELSEALKNSQQLVSQAQQLQAAAEQKLLEAPKKKPFWRR